MNNKAVMLGLAVLAFLVAAVLVITIFRMLFGGRLRMPGGRARQARLGIVDAFDLDRQRQLIIVRRDNTEHLIMIGGPNDLVIESEIIRAEAREIREPRRDPSMGVGLGDGRIPAPPPALGKGEPPLAATDRPAAKPADEPMLPMSMPPAASEPRRDVAPEPPRAPTFPLPPRRPAPQPERRPAAPPPLPASVSRGDEVPAFSGQPAAFAPAPSAPTLPREPVGPPPSAPLPPPAVSGPAPASGPAAAPPRRPPFLKPLSSRPPLRPLQRTTPQAPAAPPPASAGPGSVAPAQPPASVQPPPASIVPPAPPPRPAPPPTVVSVSPQAPANSDAESKDALESLEEEMAKLLGRGG